MTPNLDIDQQQLVKLYRQVLASGGSLTDLEETISKKVQRLTVSSQVEQSNDEHYYHRLKTSIPSAVRFGSFLLPLLLVVVGFVLMGSALVPILGFYAKSLTAAAQPQLVAPIPPEKVLDATSLVVAQAQGEELIGQKISKFDVKPVIVDAELDYTNLTNWFEDDGFSDLRNRSSLLASQTGEYLIDIPELEIENAVVKIGGVNLEESLIQYPGTSLPGKPGSPVVFGHSVLRQFYNPKENNPRRYNSIFSTVMTLDKGDKFYVRYGDIKYTYMVQDKTEVKPTDTYILSQDYTQKQFKLVTCVPEGTYLRRGVVTAQLVKE
ncbi:MAG: sortase [Candidatus Pacebacteria bacterium]|nr:sortase [Candidatus Paceibacterota bacterium]